VTPGRAGRTGCCRRSLSTRNRQAIEKYQLVENHEVDFENDSIDGNLGLLFVYTKSLLECLLGNTCSPSSFRAIDGGFQPASSKTRHELPNGLVRGLTNPDSE
jgi:hypothetical protein